MKNVSGKKERNWTFIYYINRLLDKIVYETPSNKYLNNKPSSNRYKTSLIFAKNLNNRF